VAQVGVSFNECIQVPAGFVWDSDWLSKDNVHACDLVEGSPMS